jgi:hypothetical protein
MRILIMVVRGMVGAAGAVGASARRNVSRRKQTEVAIEKNQ